MANKNIWLHENLNSDKSNYKKIFSRLVFFNSFF